MKTVAVIGLGNRGTGYMRYIKVLHGTTAKTTAICDISKRALDEIGASYGIPEENRYLSTNEFFSKGVIADGLIIATQDKSHYDITKAALQTGYKNILLEKPVSDSIPECKELESLAKEKGARLLVCHVLRYADYYKKIMEILRSGVIGDLVHVNHTENVGYFHFAHSFVRGNWKRDDTSTPSLLAKCCHDIDLLCWFAGSPCAEVSSYGELKYFNKEHAPEGATEFCLNGCKAKKNCPYDAEFTYITAPLHKATFVKYMRRTMTGKCGATKADMYDCLRNTSYGKCVFLNDNNVCDIQVVNLKFENGVTATHTMSAFTSKCIRTSHFMGTKGELICTDKRLKMRIFGKKRTINILAANPFIPGHGEGDLRTVASFVDLLYDRLKNPDDVTDISTTVKTHSVVMAAEKSRLSGGVAVKPEQ